MIEAGKVYVIVFNSTKLYSKGFEEPVDVSHLATRFYHDEALRLMEGVFGWRWPLHASILLDPDRKR